MRFPRTAKSKSEGSAFDVSEQGHKAALPVAGRDDSADNTVPFLGAALHTATSK